MSNIYQQIWNADQEGNGVDAIFDHQEGSQTHGYVKVNSELDTTNDQNLRVLTEVHIPESKYQTFNLCQKLFNNFSLPESMPEHDTPEERLEIHEFVSAIVETKPMLIAKAYIESELGTVLSQERWYSTIIDMWFQRFSGGGDPHLSGFEHVIVGEKEGLKVQGYHFWWKYYLDDGFAHHVDDGEEVGAELGSDRITYHGSKQTDEQDKFPESVTISYRWEAPNYENDTVHGLFKKIGGFFVGCSVEGLMALGTVRGYKGIQAPTLAVIEGAKYELKLFHSDNGQHIRTFYPKFKGSADNSDGSGRDDNNHDSTVPANERYIKIIGAKINPAGHDAGLETVTLVNTGKNNLFLDGWSIKDKNNNFSTMADITIGSGEFLQIKFSGDDIQLSNKGGSISLINNNNEVVHQVSYSKAQAKAQGATVLF